MIEGIGRPRVEPSFVGEAIDRMIKVSDAASIATIRWAEQVLGRRVGGSTGTNLWGAFGLVAQMLRRGERGSVVTLLCDGGDIVLPFGVDLSLSICIDADAKGRAEMIEDHRRVGARRR